MVKTKEKKREYNKLYFLKNRERLLKNMKEWKSKNPNWRKEWELKHPGYHNDWNKKNSEKAKAIWTKAYWNNHQKHLLNTSQWKKSNPEKVRLYQLKRLASKNNSFMESVRYYTRSQWKKEKECGICHTNKNLQIHHWRYRLPVQRKDFSTLCKYCHNVQHTKRRFDVK